jgi:hypothetical protein
MPSSGLHLKVGEMRRFVPRICGRQAGGAGGNFQSVILALHPPQVQLEEERRLNGR